MAGGREQRREGSGAGERAQGFTDKPPARAPEGELARRLPSRRGCPKRRVLKGRSRLYVPVVDPEEFWASSGHSHKVSIPDPKKNLIEMCGS